MPRRHQICRVGKSAFLNHHQRLRLVGGVNPDGAWWTITEAAAIAGIEGKRWSFFVTHQGRQFDVIVATSKYGSKYLMTTLDRLQPEGLLALPECRQ
ncbi:MAG TPA: DUF3892 domain-containing protein [Stellaceae bacterium]|nr:DUF3892 domain-containing protein [Stellaceae bacterium]